MPAFEDLIVFLRPRVVEAANVPPSGHIARLDNDLYLTMWGYGSKSLSLTTPYDIVAHVFTGADGRPWTPALASVSKVLSAYEGIHRRALGSLGDTPEHRREVRELRDKLSAKWVYMQRCEARASARYDPWHPKPLAVDDPKRWITLRVFCAPRGFAGRLGYDWSSIGQSILESMDQIWSLLVAANGWRET